MKNLNFNHSIQSALGRNAIFGRCFELEICKYKDLWRLFLFYRWDKMNNELAVSTSSQSSQSAPSSQSSQASQSLPSSQSSECIELGKIGKNEELT